MAKCTINKYYYKYKNCLVRYYDAEAKLAYNGYIPYVLVKELKELLSNTSTVLIQEKRIGLIKDIDVYNKYMSDKMVLDYKAKTPESFLAILRFNKYGKFGRDQDPTQTDLFGGDNV